MKKRLIPILILILLVIGCDNIMNTPTAKVENFFGKYQKMDKEVLQDLDYILEKETDMSKDNKKDYKELLKKQYQNLSYKIINEETKDNHSTVEAEIQVLDYKTAISKANNITSKIKEMKKTNAMCKYQIQFSLTKKEGIWFLDELSEENRLKIHGLY